jgi:hypothetical protein
LHNVSSTSKVVFGQWKHVAGVFNGSSIKIYVNGVLEGSSPIGGTIASDTRPLTIGAGNNDLYTDFNPSAFANQWHGAIDEVEIFNRALSASEIQAIFTAGSAGKCKPAANTNGDGVPDSEDNVAKREATLRGGRFSLRASLFPILKGVDYQPRSDGLRRDRGCLRHRHRRTSQQKLVQE